MAAYTASRWPWGIRKARLKCTCMNNTRYRHRYWSATDTCHRIYPQTRTEQTISVRVSTLDRELDDAVERLPSGFRYAGNLEQSYEADGRVVFFDAVFVNS